MKTEEEMLVQMTAVLNELARNYDKLNTPPEIGHLIDKGYNLSIEGWVHLNLLDKRDEEIKLLKQSLERVLHIVEYGWDDNERQAIIEAQQLLKLNESIKK